MNIVAMLIMFGGFVAAMSALTFVEIRRIRKKLGQKAAEPKTS
jgi:hypothetical protein